MIYFIFSVLGLAAVAEKVLVAFSCVVAAAARSVVIARFEPCFWSLAPASICTHSHGNCTRKLEIACQCRVVHRFYIKIWHEAL